MAETDEYCRPASLEDLKTLIESLNRQLFGCGWVGAQIFCAMRRWTYIGRIAQRSWTPTGRRPGFL